MADQGGVENRARGANRSFRDPWFALQVAGFRRAPGQMKDFLKTI
jgi:hypothetical protein